MALFNRQNFGYSKMSNMDPDEVKSRRAQFLIYKSLQRADVKRSRPSWLRVRMNRLKIKIGKRFKSLRRGFSSNMLAAKVDFCKQISGVLKSCKYLINGKQAQIVRTLPPVF